MPEPISRPITGDVSALPDGRTPSIPDTQNLTNGTDEAAPSVAPPTSPERYSLGEEIARGGMGIIYRATDTVLGRAVAVKVLQEKYAPASTVARRFTAEARITAQLQHPAIPPVHDFGSLPDGRPFLAMKLVKGSTLNQLLRQRSDPTADRGRFLAVFEQVCQAVAFAHAHRVIHRDLKPANVMVGGFGEVQVMDWGLAKVLRETTAPAPADADLIDTVGGTQICASDSGGSDEGHTQAGSILGTLAFMAPEQAAGEIGKVDTRSDVFGLGAILTVILTGLPPYIGPDAEAARVMAIRGDLSACLARLDGCGAEPDLVALCKRCLAFAPGERPKDGGAVAAEIAQLRFAAEERARAAETERSAAEARAAEQRRKRKWQLAAAGTLVLALVAGLGGLGLYLRAQTRANADLQAANQREHERFQLALDAIKTFHTGVSEDALLKEEQFKGLRERLLREAAGFYGKLQVLLEDQPDPSSQRALAESYFLLAVLMGKVGSEEEALAGHRRALELRRQLAARGEPGAELEVARSLQALADCLRIRGDDAGQQSAMGEAMSLAEAAGEFDEALIVRADSHEQFVGASIKKRAWKELLFHTEKGLEIRLKLADGNPDDTSRRRKLGLAYNYFGVALKYQQRYTESLQAYQKAIDIFAKEADANPGDASIHSELARAHNNKGGLHHTTGEEKEAVSEFTKAIDSMQRGIDANPVVSVHRNDLAYFGNNLGNLLYYDLGRYVEALQVYRRSASALQPVVDAHTTNIYCLTNLEDSYRQIGSLLVVLGKPGEALPELDKALRIDQRVAEVWSKGTRGRLGRLDRERGLALQKLRRFTEAAASYREAIGIWEKRAKPASDDLYSLACCYALLHGVAREKESGITVEDADAAGERAVAALRQAIAAGFRDLAEMRKETDLDSLRKRPDFEKVLKELEEKAAANSSPTK